MGVPRLQLSWVPTSVHRLLHTDSTEIDTQTINFPITISPDEKREVTVYGLDAGNQLKEMGCQGKTTVLFQFFDDKDNCYLSKTEADVELWLQDRGGAIMFFV